MILLHLGRYAEALPIFTRAYEIRQHELRGESECYLDDIGTTLWLMDRRAEAIDAWRGEVDGLISGRVKFGDLAGGVSPGLLLWYGGVATGTTEVRDHALRFLRNRAKDSRIKYFAGHIALFLIGEMTFDKVLEGATGSPDLEDSIRIASTKPLQRRHLINALFYRAITKREAGRHDDYIEHLKQCVGLQNPLVEQEWFLARHELALAGVK
jgi:hypothetical protein